MKIADGKPKPDAQPEETETEEKASTSAAAGTAMTWDWDRLVAELFPRLIFSGRRHYSKLSFEDFEDAIQQVSMEIMMAGRPVKSPEDYISRAFFWNCYRLDRLRRPEAYELFDQTGPSDPRGWLNARCDVVGALVRMTERCRDLMTRWALEGHTLNETAELTGFSQKTVWKRIHRCLASVRKWANGKPDGVPKPRPVPRAAVSARVLRFRPRR